MEIDTELAGRLARRFAGTNVTVENADATKLPYGAATFTAAVCFTMLHHVPTAELQDRLLAEVRRVVRPGGFFAGSDSLGSLRFRLAHVGDTMTLVDPERFADRLVAVRFEAPHVESSKDAFRFRARVPAGGPG